nr:Rv2175c family DNA-binding protein [Leucobacter chromiiresistens]
MMRAGRGRIALAGTRWQSGIVAENTASDRSPLTTAPMLSVPELVDRLGITPGRLHRLIEDHVLASVRIDGAVRVPEEFLQGDEPLPSLRGTLLVLNDAGFSEEEAVIWMLSTNEELGERPIDSLQSGRKSAVRRATQALAF